MKKVFILASVASMIDQFNIPNIKLLTQMGYKVHVGCNFKEGNTCTDEKISQLQEKLSSMDVKWFQIDFARNITKIGQNIKAYKQVKKLMTEEKYEFVHCHSPIGGVVGRLVAHDTKTKVIYTAHGFHFYKGASLKNWMIYYPVEWFLAHWTDVLITINQEDYSLAQIKMKAKKVVYVPGIGVDVTKFCKPTLDRTSKRSELEIPANAILLLSVGELNENKNHEIVIRAIAGMDVYYMIAGQGDKKEHLKKVAIESGMADRFKLIGFRRDVSVLYAISDIFVFPSLREGLSVSLIEAMAAGLPCIVSRIRGNTDLIKEGKGGLLFNCRDVSELTEYLKTMCKDSKLRSNMSKYNMSTVKNYNLNVVIDKLRHIYNEI